jgi:A/G-specific adenine glycosylase
MTSFAGRVITWQKNHGRHDLPWQPIHNIACDPYAIWVSEIMLQQTQVAAVIGYYSRFMQRFPTIASLASAEQEEVLQLWSGLGYYSRARNLHNAAQIIVDEYAGQFPQDFEVIQSLPGIGRSTAAAIASFAFNQPCAILDGNVKRVFTRYFLVEGWPGTPKIEKQLWALAEDLLPEENIVAYTQGLMDLGATLCSRTKPRCSECPLNQTCEAYKRQCVNALPTPKPRKTIPEKQTTMLILRSGNEVMLEKRPPTGIWGGLWSLPEISASENPEQSTEQRYGVQAECSPALKTLTHAFTHFRLHIQPQPMQVLHIRPQARETGIIWLPLEDAIGAALPTPVRKILLSLK